MKSTEALQQIIEEKNINITALGEKMGLSKNTMYDRIYSPKRKSLTFSVICPILKLLDYKVVIMPREKKVPEGSILIDEGEDS